MLQNLTKSAWTRRPTDSLLLGTLLPTRHVSKRFRDLGRNRNILNFLEDCEKKEDSSPTRNEYKIRSFGMAAAAIKKLDFCVEHGDELKGIKGVRPGIVNRINEFLGYEKKPLNTESTIPRTVAVSELSSVPGLSRERAEALYDTGCDTIAKLRRKRYQGALTPVAKIGLKYLNHHKRPVPKGNAETIVDFCKHFMPLDLYEIVLVDNYGSGGLREPSAAYPSSSVPQPIEILIIHNNTTDPIPTPPHPSTLKFPYTHEFTPTKQPFSRRCVKKGVQGKRVLSKIIRPLMGVGVVTDTIVLGTNVWQGWVRVPKEKGESWESRKENFDGIRKLVGDFHRVNVTYVPKKSRGAALLALTGDFSGCTAGAIRAGLFLNEWGLWKWKPDPQPLSPLLTSDAPGEKTSLGARWRSGTEEDRGSWIQLEAFDEKQIHDAIGRIPPKEQVL